MSYTLTKQGTVINGVMYKKYTLLPSGISVTLIEVEGPLVSGDIVFRTLASNDQGLPHTLEHLVFLGSDSYPKGYLDLAANRCLAKGTNAWTCQDNTTYSVTCASPHGFFRFLPIFLDHVLFPLMTEEAFRTEVHHVTGEGEDAGVVYCEMQTYENTEECLSQRALMAMLYGEGHNYSVETGGLMKEIQKLTVDDCRSYHRSNYVPGNANIIITGMVDIEDVTLAIAPVLNKVAPTRGMAKPLGEFLSYVPKKNSSDEYPESTIKFPAADDSEAGMLTIGILGCDLDEMISIHAEEVVLEYLIGTPTSPLYAALVHAHPPFCSGVTYERWLFPRTLTVLTMQGTDTSRHPDIFNAVINVLSCHTTNMTRIRDIIKQKIKQATFDIENRDFRWIKSVLVYEHLYQELFDSCILKSLDVDNVCKALLKEGCEFWQSKINGLTRKVLGVVSALPSISFMEELNLAVNERRNTLFESLGKDGLANLDEILKKSLEINNKDIDYAGIAGLPSIMVSIPQSPTCEHVSKGCHISLISSDFITLRIFKNTSNLTLEEKLCVPLVVKLFSNLPLGSSYSRDELNDLLEKLFLVYRMDPYALYGDQVSYVFTFHRSTNIPENLDLVERILVETLVDATVVEDTITAMQLDLATRERCGYEMLESFTRETLFPGSCFSYSAISHQKEFLANCISDIAGTCNLVKSTMEKFVSSPGCVHLSDHGMATQKVDFAERFNASDEVKFTPLKEYTLTNHHENKVTIVEVPGEETSYLSLFVSHPDADSLFQFQMRVFGAWFGQLDGIVGREIRGKGLGYHFYIKYEPSQGITTLSIQMSNDIVKAYQVTKNILLEVCSDASEVIDEHQVELAKDSVIYSLVSEVSTPHQAVEKQIKDLYRDEPDPGNDICLLRSVTRDDIVTLCREHVMLLFSQCTITKALVTCPPGKMSGKAFAL